MRKLISFRLNGETKCLSSRQKLSERVQQRLLACARPNLNLNRKNRSDRVQNRGVPDTVMSLGLAVRPEVKVSASSDGYVNVNCPPLIDSCTEAIGYVMQSVDFESQVSIDVFYCISRRLRQQYSAADEYQLIVHCYTTALRYPVLVTNN
ncbi:hypothetical protein J6590_013870 [Homalodisca vitripennis]|nr:hypothetical protein J6590_013870 [Homalodisca vitripennis]